MEANGKETEEAKSKFEFIKRNSFFRAAKYILVVLLPLIFTYYGAIPIYKSLFEEKKLYIAVVTSESLPNTYLAADFKNGFRAFFRNYGSENIYNTINKEKIIIEYKDDYGKPERARTLANDLMEDKKCIFYIGNSDSTLTSEAIEVFLQNPIDAPAMLIPMATAVEPIKRANDSKYKSFVRILPNNLMQAKVIANLAIKCGKGKDVRVAIFSDITNPSYSVNLNREISKNIRTKKGAVIIEELIGTTQAGITHSFYSSYPVWQSKDKSPTVIVYAGLLHHCLLLIDQISTLGIDVPVIFSDGCMEEELLEMLKNKKLRNKAFLVTPTLVAPSEKNAEKKSFFIYGWDTGEIVKQILDQNSDCSRKKISEYIRDVRVGNKQLNIEGKAGDYHFDKDGENTKLQYHVYDVSEGKLVPFDYTE